MNKMLICKCPHCGEEHWCNHADLGTEFKSRIGLYGYWKEVLKEIEVL